MTTILLHRIEQTEDEVEAEAEEVEETRITEITKRINFMILKEEEGDEANTIQDQETSLMLSAIGATGMAITNLNVELICPKTMGKIQILQKNGKKYLC